MAERPAERTPELLAVREARWDARRGAQNLAAVHRRVERARLVRRAALTSVAAAACALVAVAVWSREDVVAHLPAQNAPLVTPPAPPAADAVNRTVRFNDGSHVELLDDTSAVEVVHVSAQRVEVALTEGRGRFVVQPRAERQFVVRVATLSLEVLGTSFTVQRQAERVHVSVQHGRVEVVAPGERRVLEAEEAAWFATELQGDASGESAAAPVEVKQGSERRSARERFLEHARKRHYAHAMAALRERPNLLKDRPEELMLAADAARLSGDAAAAVPYLKRVAEQHGRDARAPLAAFTLGRIYLFDLNRPAEAERAFALTRELAARGPLAEDALAREVEAATRSGRQARARELAREYLRSFPDGRRRAELERIAGAE